MERYEYIKAGDELASQRVLHAVTKPANISALDVSMLSEEEQNKAVRLYDEWVEKIKKPYDVEERVFRTAHLVSFEAYAKANGMPTPPMIKSFKPQGLTKL
jgi:phosphopantothenoylcysteine synthetase/decarboxylase